MALVDVGIWSLRKNILGSIQLVKEINLLTKKNYVGCSPNLCMYVSICMHVPFFSFFFILA